MKGKGRDKGALLVLGLALTAGACGPLAVGPAERPGLGTRWGETSLSPIREVSFERDAPERPVAVAVLHYDDGDGLRALAGGSLPRSGAGLVDGTAAVGGVLQVRLLDESGFPLPSFWHGDRFLVEGERGQRYSIEISNGSFARVEAVATVDGLDVMDGGPGSYAKRGYVLRPGETYHVDGFRRSQTDVAAFRFGDVAQSYAARRGDDTDVGVIGVAFFAERGARPGWRQNEADRRGAADPFPDRFASPPPGAAW
ncbi:MAG TPA: hypothetical protein VKZ18_18025 [Polyangia bacterium]|nr:hypothetical protein [Polyangia bacterium]